MKDYNRATSAPPPAPPEERCGKELRYPEAWLPCDLPKGHDGAHYPAPLADPIDYSMRGEQDDLKAAPLADGGNCDYCGEPPFMHHDDKHARMEIAALRSRVAELERVIEWALGERGDFPSLPDDWPKRKFYWRTELRERAFGKSKAKVSG